MKIMNIFRIILAAAVVIAVQVDAAPKRAKKNVEVAQVQPSAVEIEARVDSVTDGVRQNLESATSRAAEQITAATIKKNHAIAAGLEGMPQDAVKAIIDTQDALIAQIKQGLMQLAENAVAMVDDAEKQASYASQFITGAQKFGSWIWNPAAEQERNLAQAIILRLEEEKQNTTNPAIIKQLDQQINDQKLITGDKMSTRQLLLIGAVGAAATVAGVSLGSKYFSGLSQELTGQELTGQEPIIVESIITKKSTRQPRKVSEYPRGSGVDPQAYMRKELGLPPIGEVPTAKVTTNAELLPAQESIILVQEPAELTPGQKIVAGLERDVPKAYEGVMNVGKNVTGAIRNEFNQSIEDVKEVGRAFGEAIPASMVEIPTRLATIPTDLTPEGLEDMMAKRELTATPINMVEPGTTPRGVESAMSQKNRENRKAQQARNKANREAQQAANKAKAAANKATAEAKKAAKAAAQ